MPAKILLAEDEEHLLDVVKLNLEIEGYDVEAFANGREALEALHTHSYDLVLLDVMLPGINGFDICREFRRRDTRTPVLFLTAKGTGEDRVTGLKIGADDYLVKPFHLEELLLRVRNLIQRHGKAETQDNFSFGAFTVNFLTYEIFKNEEKLAELTKRETLLLKMLTEKPNQVVSREDILDKIWGEDAFPSSRTIDNYILAFRKYFEENPREPRHFHSVRGVGYKFTP